ncbi:MAG TPA: hypothetical protein VIJ82_33460 [Streptosporangiaceae bacterium]
MLLRRTLAAMGITIGVFLAVRVPVEMSIWSMTSVRTGLRHRLGHVNGGGTAPAGLPGGGGDELRAGLRLTDLRFRGGRLTDPGS